MTTAEIDLAAHARNVGMLRRHIAPAELMVVVKADAYGHGLLPIARSAVSAGVSLIGVLDAGSGLALRSAGFGQSIRMFAWLFAHDEDYSALIDADIELGVSSVAQLDRIAGSGGVKPALVHLKIDTGLHRNGASEKDWPDLVARAVSLERAGVIALTGAWTHIGEASDDDDTEAIDRFKAALTTAEGLGARFPLRHLAASAAGFHRPDARFGAVRIGAFTYGIAPGDGVTPSDIGIEPVMTLTSEVTSVTADAGGLTATVGAGFLDGVPSTAAGRVSIAVRGERHPIIEVRAAESVLRVSGEVRVGDQATLFGSGRRGEGSLQEWADAIGTIGEELVVRIPSSVQRRYIGGDAAKNSSPTVGQH